MRLLVVGASGQVGLAVRRAAEHRGDMILGGFVSRPPDLPADRLARVDKSEVGTLASALERLRPEWVVDTGALHHVDYCESHPQEAFAVNREGTGAFASACRSRGVGYVFVSTDFVFDGNGNPPYREEDEARPLSVYARSKLEGEAAALAADPSALVVRPSVIYSWVPKDQRSQSASQKPLNFGTWAIDQLRAGQPLRIVDDQVASPTLADDLAGAILALIDHRARGIYHTAGGTALSRYAFTVQMAEALGLGTSGITPITTASLNQKARRPPNSSLDSTRVREASGHAMWTLPQALDRLAKAVAASGAVS
jgi:dTDP-4-dehydrorhamnose reductase